MSFLDLSIFLFPNQVEQAKQERKFSGEVVGPIGMYLKISAGKENFAALAETAIGGGLMDRFIVTNDSDRSYFMKLRTLARCSPRDCCVFQMVSCNSIDCSPIAFLLCHILNRHHFQ